MSFIATDQQPTATINNDGFFPDIEIDDFDKVMCLTHAYNDEQKQHVILNAIISVNQELKTFKEQQSAASLNDIDSTVYGNTTEINQHYKNAVYYTAIAQLNEKYTNYDSTNNGRDSQDLQTSIDDYLKVARNAINSILGKSQTLVELI